MLGPYSIFFLCIRTQKNTDCGVYGHKFVSNRDVNFNEDTSQKEKVKLRLVEKINSGDSCDINTVLVLNIRPPKGSGRLV